MHCSISLSANAAHGLQRKQGDNKRAYEIACRDKLVDPGDAEAVATLLRCTGRWGEILTQDARNAAKTARDAAIVAGKEVGKTVRQIAKETGASIGTVFGVQKTNTSENEHPIFALTFDQLLGDSLELRRGGSWADDGKETD